jgi:hypothetical protein
MRPGTVPSVRVNLPYHLRTLSVPTRNTNVTACVTHDRGLGVTVSHTTATTAHPCRTSRPRPARGPGAELAEQASCTLSASRSRACHVDAKVVRRAGTHRRAGGLPRSEESACGRHLRRRPCSTRWRARQRSKSAHSASTPSVARTCSAMRLNSPLRAQRRCCARLRPILHSLTGRGGRAGRHAGNRLCGSQR